ncbi:MAG: hypothetical protein K9L74_07335 [Candidatus Izimaplasma sp.]|nr:hypothetical protein [Candidatus Izimaplasma bacterium]
MTDKSQNINELFEKWILDSEIKLNEESLIKNLLSYLEGQHPEICGKCTPCRDGVIKLETLLKRYQDKTATLKTLDDIEKLTYNLRSSRCSVGLDIGKNMEVVLENHYHILYDPVKEY